MRDITKKLYIMDNMIKKNTHKTRGTNMTKSTQFNIKKEVKKIVNNNSILDTLFNLHNRWQDEKKYEDWKDYENFMIPFASHRFKFIKSTKRPFGFIIQINDTKVNIFLKIRKNSINLAAKAV